MNLPGFSNAPKAYIKMAPGVKHAGALGQQKLETIKAGYFPDFGERNRGLSGDVTPRIAHRIARLLL
jgi:hypothetical protein